MTKKEKIVYLAQTTNASNKEIAKSVQCSEAYVCKVVSDVIGRIILTPQRYIEARKIFGDKKEVIAQSLGVSRWTLNRWENATKIGLHYDAFLAALKPDRDFNLWEWDKEADANPESVWKAFHILQKALYHIGEIAQYDEVANKYLKALEKIVNGFIEIKRI